MFNDNVHVSLLCFLQGALDWQYNESDSCADPKRVQHEGFHHVKRYDDNDNGGLVAIDV